MIAAHNSLSPHLPGDFARLLVGFFYLVGVEPAINEIRRKSHKAE